MSYKKNQLPPYLSMDSELIPINPWNKMKKGKERGKTPVDMDWTTKQYKQNEDQYISWIEKGYNLGYRIQANQIVVDLDPRNYDGTDSEQLIAEAFGYFDFEDLVSEHCAVKTGGGGWHIYCTLPKDIDYIQLRETVEVFPGVEFKRKGRQVLCAGSRHPSGEYYKWVNKASPLGLPEYVLELIKRSIKPKQDYTNGKGCLTGQQLQDLVLSRLNPEEFSSNDEWFPLLCGSHHATNGEGIEEFVEWSTSDPLYADDENIIRQRWESLWDKEHSATIGTLIHRLEQFGEDSSGVKAMLSFANMPTIEADDEDSEESEIMSEATEIAQSIDIEEMLHIPSEEAGVEGAAINMARTLKKTSPKEDIMKCLRLIKAADSIEALQAQDIMVSSGVLKQGNVTKLLKELDTKMADDLALLLSQKTLEKTFNQAKHLTCPPSGILYAYHKTHWRQISNEFLAKLVQNVLHVLKKKVKIEAQELSLINQAVSLSRIQVATLTDKIHRTTLPPSVVNCKNGELWLNKDGSHQLKPHNYRSYLLNCLNVDYDPSAECPLFMETIRGIFAHFEDTEDMVRHIGELMGYTIQPYKNIASWWLFRGPGGDGKSTLLKILGGILGDAQTMTSVKILNIGSSSGDSHAITNIVGALNLVIEELPANYLLKDEGVKMFSENTKMECNPKGKDRFNFMYAANLIMCSNGYPATRDLSHGMVRRANVIPFNRQFTKTGSEDIDRAIKILEDPKEMSGVLNFMLEGLQRLRNRGRFQNPVSCEKAKENWMEQSNNVVKFFRETIELTGNADDHICSLRELYNEAYAVWCENNDIDTRYRKRKSHFKQDLINLGLEIKIGGGNAVKVYGGKLKKYTTEDFIDVVDNDEIDNEFDDNDDDWE